MKKKESIRLSNLRQRNLLFATSITTFIIIGLLNIYIAPLLFFSYSSYIVLNKNKRLTKTELLGFFTLFFPFLIYSIISRLAGRGPGLLITLPIIIFSLILYVFVWRFTR